MDGREPLSLLFDKSHLMEVDGTLAAIEGAMVPVILVLVRVRLVSEAGAAIVNMSVFRNVLVMLRTLSAGYVLMVRLRSGDQCSPVVVVTKELSKTSVLSPAPNRANGSMPTLAGAGSITL